MVVKLFVSELVMAGQSTQRLGSLAELGAIQGDGKQGAGYSDAEPHKRNLHQAQRKGGRKEGTSEQQGDEFRPQGSRGCFVMAGYLGSLNSFHSFQRK